MNQLELSTKMKDFPTIIIIILSWEGTKVIYENRSILSQCLESLRKIKYPNYKVLVADVSNSSDTENFMKKEHPDIKIIKEQNISWSSNNNQALKAACREFSDFDYVAFVSDDIIFSDSYVFNKLINEMLEDKKIGISTCNIKKVNGENQYAGLKLSKFGIFKSANITEDRIMKKNEYIVGAFFLVSYKLINKIGFLDETYVMMGSEDTDLCERAYRAGFNTYFLASTYVSHVGSASTLNLTSDINGRWLVNDIKRNMRLNTYIFHLRYKKGKLLPYFIFDSIANVYNLKNKSSGRRLDSFKLFRNALRKFETNKIIFLSEQYKK